MLRFASILVFALTCVFPTMAAAWHIGPNFGFSHVSSSDVFLYNWGSGTNFLGVSQPGMRLGWSIGGRKNELYTATGLDVIRGGTETDFGVTATLNYQRNFDGNAFITGGVGVFSVGNGSTTATVPVYGGGIGYFYPIASGHGRFRWEVRLDRQAKDQNAGLPATNLVTARLGFDLFSDQ